MSNEETLIFEDPIACPFCSAEDVQGCGYDYRCDQCGAMANKEIWNRRPITREQVNEWIGVEERLPEAGEPVLIYGPDDQEIGYYTEKVEDSIDVMGHDSGWISMVGFAYPGRSFGQPEYIQPSQGQPTHWMPFPKPPVENSDE